MRTTFQKTRKLKRFPDLLKSSMASSNVLYSTSFSLLGRSLDIIWCIIRNISSSDISSGRVKLGNKVRSISRGEAPEKRNQRNIKLKKIKNQVNKKMKTHNPFTNFIQTVLQNLPIMS